MPPRSGGSAPNLMPVPPGPAPQVGTPAAVLQRLRGVAGLDVERGVRAVLGRVELYVGVVRRFAAGAELAALRGALADGRAADAQRAAHSMRGAAGTLGHDALAALATSVEDRLRDAGGTGVGRAAFDGELDAMQQHFSALTAATA
jgi:two-component system sensor histidine kinase/response regulator